MNGHFGNKSRSAKRLLRILTAVCAIALAAVLWRIWSRPDVPPLDPVLLERPRPCPLIALLTKKAKNRCGGSWTVLRTLHPASAKRTGLRPWPVNSQARDILAPHAKPRSMCPMRTSATVCWPRSHAMRPLPAIRCPGGARAVKNMQGRGVKIDAVLLLNARLRQCAKETAGQPASEAISPPARRFGQEGQPKP